MGGIALDTVVLYTSASFYYFTCLRVPSVLILHSIYISLFPPFLLNFVTCYIYIRTVFRTRFFFICKLVESKKKCFWFEKVILFSIFPSHLDTHKFIVSSNVLSFFDRLRISEYNSFFWLLIFLFSFWIFEDIGVILRAEMSRDLKSYTWIWNFKIFTSLVRKGRVVPWREVIENVSGIQSRKCVYQNIFQSFHRFFVTDKYNIRQRDFFI